MASSPWGAIEYSQKLVRGVRFVSTASHGGLMLTFKAASRLTEAARAEALRYSSFYCFEEDCDWAIPAWELPEVREAMGVSQQEVLECLQRWNPQYLQAVQAASE